MTERKRQSKVLAKTKSMGNAVLNRIGEPEVRPLRIARVSAVGNVVFGVGKLALGIASMSLLTCVNAFYTFGMVGAKSCVLAGAIKEENTTAQYRYYKISGIVLIVASALYIAYSAWLVAHPVTSVFSIYIALSIATFTFAELAVNIRGVIVYRHEDTPLLNAIKMINLASSLICLVLTQTALIALVPESQAEMHPATNGFMGILMGSAAVILGIVMIRRINKIQAREMVENPHD